jgi:riboflavin synthase
MFTGLIDDIGTIDGVATTDAGLELRIRCRYDDLTEGESIAVNGACLTVRESSPGSFTCAAVATTLAVTTIGGWKQGQRVNLERALRMTDRLGGHIVQGHVDGVGRVVETHADGDALVIHLAVPPGLSDLMVERGSITVDGVSLTIVGLPDTEVVQLSLIEVTRSQTTLGALDVGDAVHVETDIIAKYVRRLLEASRVTHDS